MGGGSAQEFQHQTIKSSGGFNRQAVADIIEDLMAGGKVRRQLHRYRGGYQLVLCAAENQTINV